MADGGQCAFPGTSSACWKCGPCLQILEHREKAANGNEALIEQQSHKVCRICRRKERYCKTDGKAGYAHDFAPVMTCESCTFMGGKYWGNADLPIHFCRKSGERRAVAFKSSGDFAEDFMSEFRKFYDASPKWSAETCPFFEPRRLAKEAPDA